MKSGTESAAALKTAHDVGDAILEARQHPMDRQTSEVLLRLTIAGEGFSLSEDESSMQPTLRIARQRLRAFRVPAHDSAVMMIAALSGMPGEIVMYCSVLKALADRLGRAATIFDLCDAFPMGFPDRDALTEIWDRQKVHDGNGSDNWLDRSEAWEDCQK